MDSFDTDRFCVYSVIPFDVLHVKPGIDFLLVINDSSRFNIEYMRMLLSGLISLSYFFFKERRRFLSIKENTRR